MPDSIPTDSQGSALLAVPGRFLPEGSEVWVFSWPAPDGGLAASESTGFVSHAPPSAPPPAGRWAPCRLLPKEPLYCPLVLLVPAPLPGPG